jgi:hypothetical protein
MLCDITTADAKKYLTGFSRARGFPCRFLWRFRHKLLHFSSIPELTKTQKSAYKIGRFQACRPAHRPADVFFSCPDSTARPAPNPCTLRIARHSRPDSRPDKMSGMCTLQAGRTAQQACRVHSTGYKGKSLVNRFGKAFSRQAGSGRQHTPAPDPSKSKIRNKCTAGLQDIRPDPSTAQQQAGAGQHATGRPVLKNKVFVRRLDYFEFKRKNL